ncbi:MAG: A/G-specific adenine glycosylase [Rhodocyclaceae bacterium]|nr:A/G-specific adenine glycosylase [Rhodocyclaceae bacterium]
MPSFASRLIAWHRRHGRHDLPWQGTRDPYRVWLSEIMLQQTQVATVIPYYHRFLANFPDIWTLAAADLEAVLTVWSGLGYYARARHLHRCAREIVAHHGGLFPRCPQALARLPGIGRSTANAIAVFCFGARAPILDGNVRRLLCRHAGLAGPPGSSALTRKLWQLAETLLPESEVDTYIQAQMDLGAMVCRRHHPACEACPVAEDCHARRMHRTEELPAPRLRRALPRRQVVFLILQQGRHFLLEVRPPTGFWGGLWCLPELPPAQEVKAYCRHHLGLEARAVCAGPAFSHVFTHFRLEATTFSVEVVPAQCCEPTLKPVARAGVAFAPLPAPIKKLLSAIP